MYEFYRPYSKKIKQKQASYETICYCGHYEEIAMLKRIHVQHLTLGMHIHEFCGSWMEHPFWRTQFVLTDPKDLASIRATTIKEVWIDVARGLDVAPGVASTSEAEAQAQVENTFQHLNEVSSVPLAVVAPVRDLRPTSMAQELETAAAICRQSKLAVTSMFNEARLGKATDTGAMRDLVEDISSSVIRNPGALISLARLKTADDYSYMHSVAVCALMVALARQLQLDAAQTQLAGMAGLLHDLGKATIPLEVLNKPGKLTDEEFAVVRHHPVAGWEMLREGGKTDAAVLDACRHHHEKIDGTGYPDGLSGQQIHLIARMTAICDVYDAITSNRPYKAGWDPAESLRRMAQWSEGHFDIQIFHAFVKSIGIYPAGSLVRLSSGRLGVVTDQNRSTLTAPWVKVFYCTRTQQRIPPEIIDLSRPGCQEKITGREDPEQWHFPDLVQLWSGLDISHQHTVAAPAASATAA
jgi:putative nucleotidyltransferase with HDIG domain